jgi:hypothetical protein
MVEGEWGAVGSSMAARAESAARFGRGSTSFSTSFNMPATPGTSHSQFNFSNFPNTAGSSTRASSSISTPSVGQMHPHGQQMGGGGQTGIAPGDIVNYSHSLSVTIPSIDGTLVGAPMTGVSVINDDSSLLSHVTHFDNALLEIDDAAADETPRVTRQPSLNRAMSTNQIVSDGAEDGPPVMLRQRSGSMRAKSASIDPDDNTSISNNPRGSNNNNVGVTAAISNGMARQRSNTLTDMEPIAFGSSSSSSAPNKISPRAAFEDGPSTNTGANMFETPAPAESAELISPSPVPPLAAPVIAGNAVQPINARANKKSSSSKNAAGKVNPSSNPSPQPMAGVHGAAHTNNLMPIQQSQTQQQRQRSGQQRTSSSSPALPPQQQNQLAGKKSKKPGQGNNPRQHIDKPLRAVSLPEGSEADALLKNDHMMSVASSSSSASSAIAGIAPSSSSLLCGEDFVYTGAGLGGKNVVVPMPKSCPPQFEKTGKPFPYSLPSPAAAAMQNNKNLSSTIGGVGSSSSSSGSAAYHQDMDNMSIGGDNDSVGSATAGTGGNRKNGGGNYYDDGNNDLMWDSCEEVDTDVDDEVDDDECGGLAPAPRQRRNHHQRQSLQNPSDTSANEVLEDTPLKQAELASGGHTTNSGSKQFATRDNPQYENSGMQQSGYISGGAGASEFGTNSKKLPVSYNDANARYQSNFAMSSSSASSSSSSSAANHQRLRAHSLSENEENDMEDDDHIFEEGGLDEGVDGDEEDDNMDGYEDDEIEEDANIVLTHSNNNSNNNTLNSSHRGAISLNGGGVDPMRTGATGMHSEALNTRHVPGRLLEPLDKSISSLSLTAVADANTADSGAINPGNTVSVARKQKSSGKMSSAGQAAGAGDNKKEKLSPNRRRANNNSANVGASSSSSNYNPNVPPEFLAVGESMENPDLIVGTNMPDSAAGMEGRRLNHSGSNYNLRKPKSTGKKQRGSVGGGRQSTSATTPTANLLEVEGARLRQGIVDAGEHAQTPFGADGGNIGAGGMDLQVRGTNIGVHNNSAGNNPAFGGVAYLDDQDAYTVPQQQSLPMPTFPFESPNPITLEEHSGIITKLRCPTNTSLLVSSSQDGTIRLWNGTGTDTSSKLIVDANNFSAGAIKPNDAVAVVAPTSPGAIRVLTIWAEDHCSALWAACSDGGLRVWNGADGKPLRYVKAHEDTITAIEGCQDYNINPVTGNSSSNLVGTGSADKSVRVWDMRAKRAQVFLFRGHSDGVVALRWGEAGRSVLSASKDKTVRIWDTRAGRLRVTLERHFSAVNALRAVPNAGPGGMSFQRLCLFVRPATHFIVC